MEGWNTELEIEIRVMQEKFRELANNEKSQVRVNMIQAAIADVDTQITEAVGGWRNSNKLRLANPTTKI